MNKRKTLLPISSIIEKASRSLQSQSSPEATLVLNQESILGQTYSGKASISGEKKGALLIHCHTATLRTELQFEKSTIIQRANSYFPKPIIRSILFI